MSTGWPRGPDEASSSRGTGCGGLRRFARPERCALNARTARVDGGELAGLLDVGGQFGELQSLPGGLY
jgi:hypothetical protein